MTPLPKQVLRYRNEDENISGIFLALLYYVTLTDTCLMSVSLFNHILHKGTCCPFVYHLVPGLYLSNE